MSEATTEIQLDAVRERIVAVTQGQAELLESASGAVSGMQSMLLQQETRLGDAIGELRHVQGSNESGRGEVDTLASSITEIQDIVGQLGDALTILETVFERTDAIREIITDIRMLGLNAAIEAARAGESGQGFSVVATSMRELARSGSRVVDEITDVVGEGLGKVTTITRTAQERLGFQAQQVHRVRSAFDEMESHLEGLGTVVHTIEETSLEFNQHAQVTQQRLQRSMEDSSGQTAELVGLLTGSVIEDIDVLTAFRRMDGLVVVDVRSTTEWADELGHIAGAILVPITDKGFSARIATLDRDAPTLFVCRRGGRSARGARLAVELGMRCVYNMKGGMLAWAESRLPTKGAASKAA